MLTFGLSLKTCVRVCALLGIVIGGLNIAAGGYFMLWGKREGIHSHYSKPLYLYRSPAERDVAQQYQIMYRLNVVVGGILMAINSLQVIIDALFFLLTFKATHKKFIWSLFAFGITVWIVSLVCFTNILSSGGLALLAIVLLGTSVRCYILYINHIYLTALRKIGSPSTEFHNEEIPTPSGSGGDVKD